MDTSIPSTPTPDSILRDARLLNSDIGRHSVKCNFSTRLAGRFYQNGSLERHTFRKSRLVEMQARKRRLERELQFEERRVQLLEDRLTETERAREGAHELIITIEHGLVQLQTFVRRRQALRLYRSLRHEDCMKKVVARFLQCRYRGWRGRIRANSRREYLRQELRYQSAAAIQANVRRGIQRRQYLDLLAERERLSNESAAAIQAMLRGKVIRLRYLAEISRRQCAARNVQRVWRGYLGRVLAEEIRAELLRKKQEAEKPKRIPLHLRRYSTYGSNSNGNNNNAAQRRSNASKKRGDPRMRRRSSDAMIIMKDGRLSSLTNFKSTASAGDQDENDSIATTVTSLTNQTNATESSTRRRTHRRMNPPSWPSPQRVLAASDRRRATTLQPCNKVNSRRSSLERRKTISGGLASPLHPQKASLRRPPPSLQPCDDSDGSESDDQSTPEEESSCKAEPQSTDREDGSSDCVDESKFPPREISTPIIVSNEASLIVQDVLGKGIMCHNIVHSNFEDEFAEQEDD